MPNKTYASSKQRRINRRLKYFIRRRVAIIFLGGRCELCGMVADQYTTCPYIELDHIDRNTKIRKRFWKQIRHQGAMDFFDFSPERFWNEVEKCQLLCHECHKDKTRLEESRIFKYSNEEIPF